MSNQYLYKRTWSFSIGNSSTEKAIQFQNFDSVDQSGNKIQAAPLRVTFDVQKNLVGSPNTTKFSIYNLSLETRGQLRAGNVIVLNAGYGSLIDRIFFGQIGLASIKTERSGPDIITSFDCIEGGGAILMSRINKSYPAGTKLYQIMNDIMAEMSKPNDYNPIPIDTGNIYDLPSVTYPRGRTIHGTCGEILDTLLKPLNIRWFVQNNSLIVLPNKGAINKEVIIVSQETGMIGIPTRNGISFEFQSLLNPKLQPGAYVNLIARESPYNLLSGKNVPITGYYQVRECHYVGDTYGTPWSVSCKCWALDPKDQSLIESANVSSGAETSASVKG